MFSSDIADIDDETPDGKWDSGNQGAIVDWLFFL
jgi:hypothetical protein